MTMSRTISGLKWASTMRFIKDIKEPRIEKSGKD